ncbi:MAG: SdrD B-like domain-containing protein [Pirellulales bacterium]
MGLIRSLATWYRGGARRTTKQHRGSARPRAQHCRGFEQMEPRQLLAAAGLVAPEVLLGAVYFEEATGDDSAGDVIQVSFVGGAPGTTLDRLVIDGDKDENGLSVGDVFFDTEDGGLGAFASVGLSVISHDGFDVTFEVIDGTSQIVFLLEGFDAGEKLVFSVDADEVQFIEAGGVSATGELLDASKIDTNSVVEGAEFQRSRVTGEFTAEGYVDLSMTGTFWDAFDTNMQTAESATGLDLLLPPDRYEPNHDYTDRTAGAVVHKPQVPLATLAGWVYHDRSDDGQFDRDNNEVGIGGVTLELLDANGNATGTTTVTSTEVGKVGYYEFRNLMAGTYGVREVQPDGWLDGKDTPGTHGGQAASETAGRVDRITGAVLAFGDNGVEYNFGELLVGSIAGRVGASLTPDCNFDNPDIPLEGVQIDLLDGRGNFIRSTTTDSTGRYRFDNLRPGEYQVFEHQPQGYYDGGDRIGTSGGDKLANDHVGEILLGSGVKATQYDFCEKVGADISGYVYHDRSNDGIYNRPGEEPIAGVVLKLLDANGNDTGRQATTNDLGYYEFTNLDAGTYAVMEVHPAAWLDGLDTPGTLGGIADASPSGDMIRQITVNYGDDGVEYNFGELLPGSIGGRVGASRTADCNFDNPDIPLGGVKIDLRDGQGNFIKSTTTNDQGFYRFDNLRPGEYQIFEHQPDEYYDGGDRIGTSGGDKLANDHIGEIHLGSGVDATQYDFCEKVGANISGYVYHDRSDDGQFDRPGEEPIANVMLKLLDADGNDTGKRAVTDAQGYYQFTNLAPGKYAVMEIHPDGWLDGKDTAGNLGGMVDPSTGSDMISMIMIDFGVHGEDYNFGELKPGSISGKVKVSAEADCENDPNAFPLSGVTIQLLDADGNVIDDTQTDSLGMYRFDNLRPGNYEVREIQPVAYFDGMDHLGSGSGSFLGNDHFGDIHIGSEQHLIEYDFCEVPPAVLSGFVFIDGAPIVQIGTPTPAEIAAIRDGQLTADDTRLAGIIMELRDGFSGDPIMAEQALPGNYGSGPIRVVTDAHGFYEFKGLAGGTYAVVQIHPNGLIDHIETPGSKGGYPVNAVIGSPDPRMVHTEIGVPSPADTVEQFRLEFGEDAIVRIPLRAGQSSVLNNFSEVVVRPLFIPEEPPVETPPPPVLRPAVVFTPIRPLFPQLPPIKTPNKLYRSGAVGYTWHLSIIDAGQPRTTPANQPAMLLAASQLNSAQWQQQQMDQAEWTIANRNGQQIEFESFTFGNPEAIPVTGDWDGDGVTELGVFLNGYWYLDLNGNGQWDAEDLWAHLGSNADLPVTGDWNDDGKTDIGIYGPAWPRDPHAIHREPGLPDADNYPTRIAGKMKNMPPTADEATSGARVLRRHLRGDNRADVIDHVFHYGTPGDVPVAGDWNGDGIRNIGVFRGGAWHLDMDGDGRFTERDLVFQFGQGGDRPVVGDWNGDGIDDLALFRSGQWVLDTNGNRELDALDQAFEMGGANDMPVAGDWNGDGSDDPAVYSGQSGPALRVSKAG